MAISSNSLFQFTNSLDTVKKILSDKFYGSYCKEIFHYNNEKTTLIIPMICFCDLPLETIAQYCKYGEYGLGLTKDWGIRNKLNPVLYIEKRSMIAESIVKAIHGSMITAGDTQIKMNEATAKIRQLELNKKMSHGQKTITLLNIKNDLLKLQQSNLPLQHMLYSLYYSKHYADDLERNGQITKDYRFYDEREWRFLPEFNCAVCELRRTEQEYAVWRGTSPQKPLLTEVNLSFAVDDIDHIIISKEDEIPCIKDYISALSNFNTTAKDKLIGKIVSFEKIRNQNI